MSHCACCMPHESWCTLLLHVACCMLHLPRSVCMLHVSCSTKPAVPCCVLHDACCMLRAACWMHVVCFRCMLHVVSVAFFMFPAACCTMRVACCPLLVGCMLHAVVACCMSLSLHSSWCRRMLHGASCASLFRAACCTEPVASCRIARAIRIGSCLLQHPYRRRRVAHVVHAARRIFHAARYTS